MSDNSSSRNDQIAKNKKTHQTIGNQQHTTQTGAQNNGGEHIDQQADRYTKDLKQSGDRSSSNRKK